MKTSILFFFLTVITFSAYAQDRGIGLRAGAPMGITYKKYFPRVNKAIEFGIGTLSSGWYNQYYENSFDSYDRYDGFDYLSHRVNSTLYLQGRYLLHNDIPIEGMMGKLEWYWGIGGLLKFAGVEYRYRNAAGETIRDTRTDVDFGPEGIAGMEYTFEDVPITIFGEFSLMFEFADRLALRGFSGVGARYNF